MSAGPSNLQLRVISGIVLIAVALGATVAGGIWYRLLAAAIGAAVLYEWTAMSLAGREQIHRAVLGMALAVVLLAMLADLSVNLTLVLLAGGIAIGAAHAAVMGVGFWPVAGLAYAGLCAISLATLRGADATGLAATLFLFAVVWATDILAYFTGRSIGGPKLAPSISPGKTWSGAVGGTVSAIIAGLLVASLYQSTLGWAALVAIILVLSVISQAGDLFESSFKRRYGAKDSSQLIPGHGGVMDRVDGLAAAAFAMFVVGALVYGPEAPARAFFGG